MSDTGAHVCEEHRCTVRVRCSPVLCCVLCALFFADGGCECHLVFAPLAHSPSPRDCDTLSRPRDRRPEDDPSGSRASHALTAGSTSRLANGEDVRDPMESSRIPRKVDRAGCPPHRVL